MKKEATKRMLSRKDAAEFLRCSQQTVTNWVDMGILKGHKINDRLFVDADTLYAIADTVEEVELSKKRIVALRDEYEKRRNELEDAVNKKRNELLFYENSDVSKITKTAILSVIRSFEGFLPKYECNVLTELVCNGNPDLIAQNLEMSTINVFKIAANACRRIRFAEYDKKVKENEYLMKRVMDLEHENKCLKKGIPCEVKPEDNPMFHTKIVDCDLSVRAINCLRAIGAETFGDVIKMGKSDLMKCRNMGRKSMAEIEEFAKMNGMELK